MNSHSISSAIVLYDERYSSDGSNTLRRHKHMYMKWWWTLKMHRWTLLWH